jgi:hypothetical protein
MHCFLVVVCITILTWRGACTDEPARAAAVDEQSGDDELDYPLSCTVRRYNTTVYPHDEQGRQCRAHLSIDACFGSCETYEVRNVPAHATQAT